MLLSTLFSSYINSFDFNNRNSWDTRGSPKISYKEYIQEIKNLKPLSDSKNAKEIRTFRVKWYALHGKKLRSSFGKVCLEEWCFGEDYYFNVQYGKFNKK